MYSRCLKKKRFSQSEQHLSHQEMLQRMNAQSKHCNWGVSINEAFFLGGVSKTEVLTAFGAHIFLMTRIYIPNRFQRLFRKPQCLIGMEIIRKNKQRLYYFEGDGGKQCRHIHMFQKEKFELTEKPKPVIMHERDAIVKVTLASICSSDLHIKHEGVPRAVPELLSVMRWLELLKKSETL